MAGLPVFWCGRRVLITGHTGFKGAWLSHWLLMAGADVVGYALAPPTQPSLFAELSLADRLDSIQADIRDRDELAAVVARHRPEVVFHLAAQALVGPGHRDPAATWETNVGGTVNLLEAVRRNPSVRACVVVTSDKCYEPAGADHCYREGDPLGGTDPYSASKGAAELAVASWRRSFFAAAGATRLLTVRAGNVIGGGDWGSERLVPDLVRALAGGRALRLRHPEATRPWQYVLDALAAYLHLGRLACQASGAAYAEAWNVGPLVGTGTTVRQLAGMLAAAIGRVDPVSLQVAAAPAVPESAHLQLDASKLAARTGWLPVWDLDTCVRRTARWYQQFAAGVEARGLVDAELAAYAEAAVSAGCPWVERPREAGS